MPFAMVDNIQSVVVQGKLYAGGGYAGKDSDYNYIITEYDPISGEWDILPPYRSLDFTMVVVSSQLVVVGGYNYITDYFKDGYASKLLGVWNKKWTHPYPEMPTARSHCSAVFYNKWLVVAGGITNLRVLSSVEVLNTHTRQWHSLPSLPIPWFSMKAAVVGDAGYFMGGYTNNDKLVQFNYDFHEKDGDFPIVDAYSVSLSALTSSLDCMKNRELWKVMPRLHQVRSTPVSINGLLLAVGGLDRRSKATASIHLYQPLKGDWVKVGDLQESQYDCTAATITGRELFVAGGHFNIQKFAIAEIGIA